MAREKKKQNLYQFLKEMKALTKEIEMVNFHMNLLSLDVEYLKGVLPELQGLEGIELVNAVKGIFDRCNASSPSYDVSFDDEMARIGLKLKQFQGERRSSKWPTESFEGDDFGFGIHYGDILDNDVDNENLRLIR